MRLSIAQALPDLTDLDSKIPGRRDLILELPTAENGSKGMHHCMGHHMKFFIGILFGNENKLKSGVKEF